MRKNTLLKLLAVFAMCFLIGASLVSCGESETTENTDIKAVVAVELKDGKLYYSYNDGEVKSVELPKASAAEVCDHEGTLDYHVLAQHQLKGYDEDGNAIFTNDKILYACNECLGAWIGYPEQPLHNYVDCNVVKAPTCTEDGYTINKQCADCGAYGEKIVGDDDKALGHDWSEFAWVGNGNYCDGGIQRSYCARNCGVEPQEKIIDATVPDGLDGIHTVTNWVKADAYTAYAHDQEVFVNGTCDVCGDNFNVSLGKLPATKMTDANGFVFDKAASTLFLDCSQKNANYVYKYAIGTLVFTYNVPVERSADDIVKHKLGNELMTSIDLVEAGKELENAYNIKNYPDIVTFKNHPVQCDEAVIAHFYCTAENDDGTKCNADISVYVKKDHEIKADAWVNVPNPNPDCSYDKIAQTQKCLNCDTILEREVDAPDHEFVYNNDTLYELVDDEYVAGFNAGDVANKDKVPYYQGVCKHGCGEVEYKLVPDYKYEVVKAPTCDDERADKGKGEAQVTYTKASDGTKTTLPIVLEKIPHKFTVKGEKVAIYEGDDAQMVKIYNADHADFLDADGKLMIHELDNIAFETGKPVLGYINCECGCTADGAPIAKHSVTVWVQKLGANAPAIVDFN